MRSKHVYFNRAKYALIRRALVPTSLFPTRETDLTSIGSQILDSRMEARVRALFGGLPIHSLMHGALSQGGILPLMPYTITVR